MTAQRTLWILDAMGGTLGERAATSIARGILGMAGTGNGSSHLGGESPALRPELVRFQALPETGALLERIDAGEIAGMAITGSKAFVGDREPWVLALIGFVRSLLDHPDPPPTFGICFGHQVLAMAAGGAVEPRPPVTRGIVEVERQTAAAPFDAVPERFRAVVSHRDHVSDPGSLQVVARAGYTDIHGLAHATKPIVSVQCHPEIDRALMDLDQHYYRHRGWEGITEEAIRACEAPRLLERFGELCRARAEVLVERAAAAEKAQGAKATPAAPPAAPSGPPAAPEGAPGRWW